jgi:hypothetical protein
MEFCLLIANLLIKVNPLCKISFIFKPGQFTPTEFHQKGQQDCARLQTDGEYLLLPDFCRPICEQE